MGTSCVRYRVLLRARIPILPPSRPACQHLPRLRGAGNRSYPSVGACVGGRADEVGGPCDLAREEGSHAPLLDVHNGGGTRKCQTHICHAATSWRTEADQQNEPDDVNMENVRTEYRFVLTSPPQSGLKNPRVRTRDEESRGLETNRIRKQDRDADRGDKKHATRNGQSTSAQSNGTTTLG